VRKTAAREILADYRTEVYRLIAEIDAATDRDSLLVEDRIKTLKNLLNDTDRRISVYMRELQRSRNGQAMYASLGMGIRAALDSRPPLIGGEPYTNGEPSAVAGSIEPTSPVELNKQAAIGPAAAEIPASSALPYGLDAAVSTATETKSSSKKRDGKKRQTKTPRETTDLFASTPEAQKPAKPKLKVQIAEMSAQGLSPSEIASRLGISLAEVDLALNLLHRPTRK
jgi:hypothetical protein